ncbi:MAG: hypothetical protein WBA05_11190 [Gordonia sp. (in: high G+C Gram-positive bacteria)]|uniref:hypothetical protein n=1 Tax=Gordonia TaxID=2053 RepID=UPI00326430CA
MEVTPRGVPDRPLPPIAPDADDRAPIELCCLLWARPDREAALAAYEDRVLALLADHGGELLSRALGPGTDDTPHETQFIRLPDSAALDAFLGDPRRRSLAAERDRVTRRTVLYPIRFAVPPQES